MTNNGKYIIYGVLWLVVGFGLLFYTQYLNNSFFKQHLIEEVRKLALRSKSSYDFSDRLSEIFQRDEELQVIVLKNAKGKILSSLYDAKRLSDEKYKQIVELHKSSESLNHELLKRKAIFFETIFDERVYLHFEKFLSLASLINFFQNLDLSRFILILLYLSVGGYLFVSLRAKTFKEIEKHVPSEAKIKKVMNPVVQDFSQEIDANVRRIENFYLHRDYMFEKQLKQAMEKISDLVYCEKISFFFRNNNQWQPYIQKLGQIFVQGDFLDSIPKRFDQMHKSVLILPTSMVVMVRTKKSCVGVFSFHFKEYNLPNQEVRKEIYDLIAKLAKPLLLQKRFEKSAIDEETGFYTYPYFYSAFKERSYSSGSWSLFSLVLEIQNFSKLSSYTTRNWSKRLVQEVQNFLDKKDFAGKLFLIARIKPDRFVIVFESETNIISNLHDLLQQIEIESRHSAGQSVDLASMVLPQLLKHKSIDSYFSYLEKPIFNNPVQNTT